MDSKLASFSKLGASFRRWRVPELTPSAGGDKPALLDSEGQVVTARGEEIEALLQRLADVNGAMSRRETSALFSLRISPCAAAAP